MKKPKKYPKPHPELVTITIKNVPSEYRELFNSVCNAASQYHKPNSEIFAEMVMDKGKKVFGDGASKGIIKSYKSYQEQLKALDND